MAQHGNGERFSLTHEAMERTTQSDKNVCCPPVLRNAVVRPIRSAATDRVERVIRDVFRAGSADGRLLSRESKRLRRNFHIRQRLARDARVQCRAAEAGLTGPAVWTSMTAAGYTVFSISHRAAPRFRYPAPVEDAQRAVRFVRHNAGQFHVRADRIGAVGGSSGGHLVESLGVLDGAGIEDDPDPVNRESAKVQCVVARAAPADLARMRVTEFMGMNPPDPKARNTVEDRAYHKASPLHHVSPNSAPILLIHGDADKSVPFEQSEMMVKALRAAG